MKQWVYTFQEGSAEGRSEMAPLLGGKGANLAEMCALGLPVPPGFTLTTEVCTAFYTHQQRYPERLEAQVHQALRGVEEITSRRFGDVQAPLLLSVRSGARASMPGMLDTVLNLGLNDETVVGLAQATQDERFAYDSYRRFIQMYANVVLNIDHHIFEESLENYKDRKGFSSDTELSAQDWKQIIHLYKEHIQQALEKPFPQNVYEQLWEAIGAVFSSWKNLRAVTYRRLHNIPEEWGTAVNIQAMVFGNRGSTSATGVAFTRNPSTGLKELYGEFLINAQGEDVVAGIRTPQLLTKAARLTSGSELLSLEEVLPDVFSELVALTQRLEAHYRDMQDLEFTVECGKLWILQTRNGKRTAKAALKIAVDMVREKVLLPSQALLRIDPLSLNHLLHPTLDPQAQRVLLGVGLPASPGAASGMIVFTSEEAEKASKTGQKVILVRVETSPEDIHGMAVAEGILTTRGGMTSHAAVVARGMGKPCIAGAGFLKVNMQEQTLSGGGKIFHKGEALTLDGSTGEIFEGSVSMVQPDLSEDFVQIMAWANAERRMRVKANADTPVDARVARQFGAEGIGLCRTEHMFFETDRLLVMQEMILADTEKARRQALAKLLPMQRQDFADLFEIMAGFPVTIRLLDPPLHEFLPHTDAEVRELGHALKMETDKIRRRISSLKEFNPMLGLRGVRLALIHPEIVDMQARAIFEGALLARDRLQQDVEIEIMVPLVLSKAELDIVRAQIVTVAESIQAETSLSLSYHIGTMIELPRAALCAESIAETADFFSFGTNDLTQTTLGISRDDAALFLGVYTQKSIFSVDPFVSLDRPGVGRLVRLAGEQGRRTKPHLPLSVCGEHGGDPSSIEFFEEIGLDAVSCSPFRVPIACLAAAQATLRKGKK